MVIDTLTPAISLAVIGAVGQRPEPKALRLERLWTLMRRGTLDHAFGVQLGHHARHGLEREPEIVGDITTGHGKIDIAGDALVHVEEEGCHTLGRAHAAEHQHMVDGTLQPFGREAPELLRNLRCCVQQALRLRCA